MGNKHDNVIYFSDNQKMNMKTINNDNNNHLDEEAGVDGNVNWHGLVGRQCASIYPSLEGAYT